MRIGDLEFRQNVVHTLGAGTSEIEDLNFAVGRFIRPLLVRTHVTFDSTSAITGSHGVWLENGQNVAAGLSITTAVAENRLLKVGGTRQVLVTSGFPLLTWPIERNWRWLLLPNIRAHFLGTSGNVISLVLYYRFAELTPDEVTELAAQRGIT